jgi:hypothetical protein
MKKFRYRCPTCDEDHEGIPCPIYKTPNEYFALSEEERRTRAKLTSDTCVIDGKWFFIRVCLEIPIVGEEERLEYGMWVSVSERSFALYQKTDEQQVGREKTPPFFAWLTTIPPPFPKTPDDALKSMVHLRPYPMRPWLELEPTDHPLAVAQREGVSPEIVQEFIGRMLHPTPPA